MSVEIPRAVQYITAEQQARFSHLTLEQIIEFLESFRVLHMMGRSIPPIPPHLQDLGAKAAVSSPATPQLASDLSSEVK